MVLYTRRFLRIILEIRPVEYIPPYRISLTCYCRFSNGDPDKVQNIEDEQYKPFVLPHEWIISSIAAKPDGSQIVYLKTNGQNLFQLYSREISQGSLGVEQLIPQLIPFDTSQSGATQLSYEMVWRPDSSQILFYSSNSSNDHTFLFDDNTGEVCELSFQGYVYLARWSSNGRYLAVLRARGPLVRTATKLIWQYWTQQQESCIQSTLPS